jgi:hypothetical protein
MSTSASPATIEPQQPLSEPSRIINTFAGPTKTFTDLKRKASWWVPYLLLAIMSIAVAFTAGQKVGWEQMAENQLKLTPKQATQLENLPPDQRQRQMAVRTNIGKYIGYGFPVMLLIILAIVAAILLFSFNFGAGAAVKYGTAMAIVVYASLPELIRGVLTIVFLYTGVVSPDGFVMQNPIGSNLGVLATPGTAMYALFSNVDVFKIWTLVLTAIGFTCVSKVKRGTAFGIVFGWFILVTLIGAGFAAMS